MSNNIFRKVSLERLSSPEQLDRLMKVTNPRSWIALTGLIIIITVAVIWGFLGSIPTVVNGQGMLIRSEGLFSITHINSGQIEDIKVVTGDHVKKGEVIARIEKPDLLKQLRDERHKLIELQEEKERLEKYTQKSLALEKEYSEQQKAVINRLIADLEPELEFMEDKLKLQQDLYEKNKTSKEVLLQTRQKLNELQRQKAEQENQIRKIDMQLMDFEKNKQQETINLEKNIESQKRMLEHLEEKIDYNTEIVSPYDGLVTEVMVERGSLINPGSKIVNIEPRGRDIVNLEAVVYVPADRGKEIKRMMEIQISPTTVMKEKHGLMLGRVTHVSDYPASRESISKNLGNEVLVNNITGNQSVIEVRAELIPSSQTESGYRWTSRGGPPQEINSGTICTASIVTEERKPITFVIPLLRSKLGI